MSEQVARNRIALVLLVFVLLAGVVIADPTENFASIYRAYLP